MASTTWVTDATHTDVQFSAKHLMVTTVRGKFNAVEGTLTFDEQNPSASRGTFSVQTASVNTGVEPRDSHLRSADFFDAERYPRMTFVSTHVEPAGDNDYRVTGDLTIRDVTRPITFDVELLGVYRGFGGARRAGFHATARLDREQWGLTWNRTVDSGSLVVSREITIEIDLAVEEARAALTSTEGSAAAA